MERMGTGLLTLAAGLLLCGCSFPTLGGYATREGIYPHSGSPKGRAKEIRASTEWREGCPDARGRTWVGGYPFSGFAADLAFIVSDPGPVGEWNRTHPQPRGLTIVYAVVSLPEDATLDSLLLPVDLVAWCLGYRKYWPWSGEEEPADGAPWEKQAP